MDIKRLFLASSAELKSDRDQVEIAVNRLNKRWIHRGLFVHLEMWEDFDDFVSPTRKQDDYNQALRACDMAAVLAYSKVGKYTAEEFEQALSAFKAMGRPLTLVYLKRPAPATATAADAASLATFEARLKALQHFPVEYQDATSLCRHLCDQLEKAWPMQPDLRPAPMGAPDASGSISMGGANHGNGNTGSQTLHSEGAMVLGAVNAQTFVGRDLHGNVQVASPASTPDWELLLAPARKAIDQLGDAATRSAATAVVQALKEEVSQPKPQDGMLARLVGHLHKLAPAAAAALASIWAEPVLQQLAKPATDAVIEVLGLK